MTTPLKSPPFGQDTSATDQVRYGILVSGAKLVAESFFRFLRTPKGSLLDDPEWGDAIADRLGSDFSQADADALPGQLEAELGRDDRVDDVQVSVVFSTIGAATRKLTITIDATFSDGSSFSMVLAYQDLTLSLLELNFGGAST